jgi:phage terminase large subunit GpA-like protein
MGYTGDKKREYDRQWVAKRRAEFFADKVCTNCGSTSRLELHHPDPSKKTGNAIWSWSKERREEEISKCVILCHSCHKEISDEQMRKTPIHGTYVCYKQGCRCKECKQANRDDMRKRRQAKRTDGGIRKTRTF